MSQAVIARDAVAIADIDVLRHQGQILGSVASAPAVWRALDEVTPAAARGSSGPGPRSGPTFWSQLKARGGLPASKVADTDLGDTVVFDVDATLVAAHSQKQGAAVT